MDQEAPAQGHARECDAEAGTCVEGRGAVRGRASWGDGGEWDCGEFSEENHSDSGEFDAYAVWLVEVGW